MESIKKHMPDIPVCLCAERQIGPEDVLIAKPDSDVGGRRAKLKAYELTPAEWQAVLYLDADTEVVAPIYRYFEWIEDGWEFVICKDPHLMDTMHNFKRANNAAEVDDLRKKIKTLDRLIAEALKGDARLSGLAGALTEIAGVGVLTAAKVVALVPELGTLGRRRSAAIAGLAPFTRDSGRCKGKTFISGGRAEVRRALFMPATVAIKHNPVLKAVYQNLMKEGKAYKVAITAIMRRLFAHMEAVAAKWLRETAAAASSTPSTALSEISAKLTPSSPAAPISDRAVAAHSGGHAHAWSPPDASSVNRSESRSHSVLIS